MALALEGIRIIDMAWLGPGPFCANMLGDLGADVIKVYEAHPERRGGPVMFLFDPAMQPGFRNCRTMGLNLKAEEGRSIFCDLAKNADVIMEGFRPGVVKRLGVDYDTIKKINPRIVYASLTGFGQDGPYRNLVGHDINYIGIGGLLGMTGPAGGAPVIPGSVIADFAAGGMSSAIGILAALMARERTGKGQFVDMSMTDAVVESTSMQISPYLLNGMVPRKGETMFTGHYPWYNIYETADGKYLSIGALEPWFFANLCELLGCKQFVEHQFAEGEKKEEIFKYFREVFLTKTRDEWFAILQQKDTCAAPIYDINELESDPQLIARRMIIEADHPTMGRVKQVGSMHKLSDSPVEVRNWSINFGQHTEEILQELGYDKTHIDELFKAEVIG
jgi:crotonobetainyl-CoA:carnitine CoA-transferase CaiB-like acyl-CoA transferase